jgi:hypothetical protein
VAEPTSPEEALTRLRRAVTTKENQDAVLTLSVELARLYAIEQRAREVRDRVDLTVRGDAVHAAARYILTGETS